MIGFTLTSIDGTDTNYYYKKNLQGDIIVIYDNDLNEIVKYNYDAWGNHKISYLENDVFVDFAETNSYNTNNTSLYVALKNPFRYRSYYYDQETGLYYLNSRYYDSELSRFINIDDISIINESKELLNGLNLFIYCNDNPIMHTDTNGQSWWSDLWDKITGVFRKIGDVIAGAIISTVLVAAGVFINVVSMGSLSIIGNTLIGAGVGGLINGIISKSNGGSFWGGYLGGVITGALTGFGLSLGPIGAMIGGTLGNFFGTMVTDTINGINVLQNNYLINLAAESLLSGIISIGAFKFGELIKIFNIPGFRDVYAGMTVWAEFSFNALFNETKKVVHLMAEYLRKLFNIRT